MRLLLVVSVLAFTPTAAQIAACTPDAVRFCASEGFHMDRLVLCLKGKQNQLSPSCKAAVRAVK